MPYILLINHYVAAMIICIHMMYIHTHIHTYILLYLYIPVEGSLLPKYFDCTTRSGIELYLMCCGVMLFLLIIYIYIMKLILSVTE